MGPIHSTVAVRAVAQKINSTQKAMHVARQKTPIKLAYAQSSLVQKKKNSTNLIKIY